jgi:hypothetical protein
VPRKDSAAAMSNTWSKMSRIVDYHNDKWHQGNQYNAEITNKLVGLIDEAIEALKGFKETIEEIHEEEGTK